MDENPEDYKARMKVYRAGLAPGGMKESSDMIAKLETIKRNAQAKVEENSRNDVNLYRRTAHIPVEPIFIASTEDIGTSRVRANHIDAALNYCMEQEKLKAAGAPI